MTNLIYEELRLLRLWVTAATFCIVTTVHPQNLPDSPTKSMYPTTLTKSQQILRQALDDIYDCDRNPRRYGYDSKRKRLSPINIGNIRGLKLKKIYNEYAVFYINENYRGLRARAIVISHVEEKWPLGDYWPALIIFDDKLEYVREIFEQTWNIRFSEFKNSKTGEINNKYYQYYFGIDPAGNRVELPLSDPSLTSYGDRPRFYAIEYGSPGIYTYDKVSSIRCDAGN